MAEIAPSINLLSDRARRVHREQKVFSRFKALSLLILMVYVLIAAGVFAARILVNERVEQLTEAVEREERLIKEYERYEAWQLLLTHKLDLMSSFFEDRKVTKAAIQSIFELFEEDAVMRSVSFSEEESTILVQGEVSSVFTLADFYKRMETMTDEGVIESITIQSLSRDETGVYLLDGDFVVNLNADVDNI